MSLVLCLNFICPGSKIHEDDLFLVSVNVQEQEPFDQTLLCAECNPLRDSLYYENIRLQLYSFYKYHSICVVFCNPEQSRCCAKFLLQLRSFHIHLQICVDLVTQIQSVPHMYLAAAALLSGTLQDLYCLCIPREFPYHAEFWMQLHSFPTPQDDGYVWFM